MRLIDQSIALEGENVSEIQSLALRVQHLNKSLDWWNAAMVWALVFVAVAAVAVVVTTRIALMRAKQVADAQEQLIQAKDKQLALDLKDRDLMIAEASGNAAAAQAKAEGFRLEIAESNTRAEEAKERAAKANLELQRFKAPRTLSPAQQARIAAKLKAFVGILYDGGIGPKGDPEPLYIFRSIHSALSSAGWTQIAWTGGEETYTEAGMSPIGLTMVTNVIVDVHPDQWEKLGAAATALAAALSEEGIDAIADSKPTTIKGNAIHIRIGRKL
jgi:hypothetical protein